MQVETCRIYYGPMFRHCYLFKIDEQTAWSAPVNCVGYLLIHELTPMKSSQFTHHMERLSIRFPLWASRVSATSVLEIHAILNLAMPEIRAVPGQSGEGILIAGDGPIQSQCTVTKITVCYAPCTTGYCQTVRSPHSAICERVRRLSSGSQKSRAGRRRSPHNTSGRISFYNRGNCTDAVSWLRSTHLLTADTHF